MAISTQREVIPGGRATYFRIRGCARFGSRLRINHRKIDLFLLSDAFVEGRIELSFTVLDDHQSRQTRLRSAHRINR